MKNRSIDRLESQMGSVTPGSLRYQVLEAAKQFKSSWIELGQYLHSVNKDKLYKDWGHSTFELYCAKEIGIRQNTAVKLLRSYSFLEKEEPSFLKAHNESERHQPTELPSYESVNALRLAKQSERLAPKDYEALRTEVLEKGGEPDEVRKKIKYLLKPVEQKELPQPERKNLAAKKMTTYIESALTEFSNLGFPNKMLKKFEELLDLLADYK